MQANAEHPTYYARAVLADVGRANAMGDSRVGIAWIAARAVATAPASSLMAGMSIRFRQGQDKILEEPIRHRPGMTAFSHVASLTLK